VAKSLPLSDSVTARERERGPIFSSGVTVDSLIVEASCAILSENPRGDRKISAYKPRIRDMLLKPLSVRLMRCEEL